ncbi:4'-phosphopantetheinyl transferase family protein [Glycomyces xiaoerkulensis]|uniref:4'-phosphopantetheinyl transferase family protein n=1 Tax=Glycomyces xiaoerkulensis TaxID=2038139 RepID=UPI0013000408|nr:4'-phosphopantetheinyl transferase superfamily protein [Glycomyces xiaoerkulensis]
MSVVEVWSIDLGAGAPPPRVAEAALGPAERRRSRRLVGRRRHEFLTSHAAVRTILAERLGCERSELRWSVGPSGKPGPIGGGTHWNLSHASDRALLAVSDAAPVGVDVVRIGEVSYPDRVAERFLTPRECRTVRAGGVDRTGSVCAQLLSRKEACIKALGIRLFAGLAIDVDAVDAAIEHPGGRLRVRDLDVPAGWAAAVALGRDAPFKTVEHAWHWPGS